MELKQFRKPVLIQHQQNKEFMKKIVYYLTISFCCCLTVFGQNKETDIKTMYRVYEEMENYCRDVEIASYLDGAKTPIKESSTIRLIDGEYYYARFFNNEIIQNNKYVIMIDHEAEEIYFKKKEGKNKQKINVMGQFNLDSLINTKLDSIYYEGKSGNDLYYIVKDKSNPIHEMHLFLKEQTKEIHKMILFYHPDLYGTGNKISITYKEPEKLPEKNNSIFKTQTYLQFKGNTAYGLGKYRNYQVTNLNQ